MINTDIKGLVLIGGKSKRMGTDKSLLPYYAMAHKTYTFDLLKKVLPNSTVYYAINNQQEQSTNTIVDKHPNLGPFGAILAALENDNNSAFFVLATDLPFLTEAILLALIKQRDKTKMATVYQGVDTKFPEPLIAIWEPKALPVLKKALKENKLKLTQLLQDNAIKIVPIENQYIQNINTYQEYRVVKQYLKE